MATNAAASGANGAASSNGAGRDERVARLREAMARADGGKGVQVHPRARARLCLPSFVSSTTSVCMGGLRPADAAVDVQVRTRTPDEPRLAATCTFTPRPPLHPQAYIVPSDDAHMSEYPPDRFKRREWMSRWVLGPTAEDGSSRVKCGWRTGARCWANIG